jgi:hypothetical protein
MSALNPKETVVTFKADASLLEALKGVPNRSEFIRTAILSALENHCPLCRGTGVLTPNQRTHWERFARSHSLEECDECHEVHLVCTQQNPHPADSPPSDAPAGGLS